MYLTFLLNTNPRNDKEKVYRSLEKVKKMKRKIIVKESKEERKVRRERYKIKRIFSNDGKYFKSLL